MRTYHTFSSAGTKALGAKAAGKTLKQGPGRAARVIALRGELGAGKTTFVQGLAKALGARGRITSPTFMLMKRLSLPPRIKKRSGFTHVYHIDAYRFRAAREAGALGLKDIFKDPSAVVLVEWPERLKGLLPRRTTAVKFRHGKRENERVIIAP